MTTITSLPKDVLTLIVSYVKLKSHLWSAAKSCKSFYAVVIPTFYHHMVIREGHNMVGIVAALSPGNAGLQHVRHLTFLPRCEHFRQTPEQELDWIFSMLTNMLPRDRLLTFTFDCSARINPKLLAVLYQRQRHLRTMRVDSCFDWQSMENGRLITSNITCLNLQVHCNKTADFGQKMIEHLQTTMIHLEISFNIGEYCRMLGLGFFQPADRARAGQLVIKSLFRHVLYGVRQQHKLRTLHLNQVPLSDLAASKLAAAVQMSRLHSLGLQKCDEPVSLLSKIQPIGCPLRMDMRCLIVTCTYVGAGEGIDDFLGRFSGLQHLVIDSEGETAIRPALSALQNHAASLRTLYLECTPLTDGGEDEEESHYECEDLRNFLSQCGSLEQLALNTPFVRLEFDKSRIKSHIKPFAEALAAAPALRTFRGLTVLNEGDDELDVHAGMETFTANAMQAWASQYFDSASQIMAFSICHSRDEHFTIQGIRIRPGFYCRGQIMKPYGRTEATALEMSREEVMEVEPASEILQLDLSSLRVVRYGYER